MVYRRWVRFGGLWRHVDFRRFWAAETVSQFGSQVTLLALPLMAAISLDASPFEMGLLTAMGTLPFLLVGLFVGVWVDRMRRRPIMVVTDIGRAAVLLAIPVVAWLDRMNMGVLYAVSFLVGVQTVFFDVAYASYVPSLVRRERLVEANSKLQASASVAQVAGPGLGGVLVGLITAPVAILLDACSFLLSAVFLRRIEAEEVAPERPAARQPMLRQIREGLSVVSSDRVLRALVGTSAVNTFAGYVFLSVYILFMSRDLDLGATAIGVVLATGGAGAFIGAMLAGPAARRFGQGPALILGQFLFGATGLTVPLAILVPSVALPLIIAAEFLQWLSLLIYIVNAVSVRQTITPDRLLGRVNATARFVATGAQPLGSLTGGVLGGLIGVPMTLVVGELGMFVAVAWLLWSPVRAIRRAVAAEEPEIAADGFERGSMVEVGA
ncbi:MAG: MFS transporter [Thermomicrobiales bacterium]